ncbi:guanine nucleotide-binding protein subunit gamma 2-like isoform X1 [Rhododendron vialii]|uniref:guanine nucleotide-binding protein subunit gamma 2-like isoform X1 n=2 Tax=Rhododendron vialii TaxID=182163 RepID=UPI00265E3E89|nr:guanine nucleotide-binding protein subunit gamma 2-like isoform X1 [Rhododendron vialii]XP_058212086.1 guanine nucleotide-binding protein subunit gamma 2-like isoform X1 [Rhododendron vialii]
MQMDMQSDSAVQGNQQLRWAAAAPDTRGKHRISADLKRLEQETRFLEEELEQLEKTEAASALCKEIIAVVETKPDPLLPVTNGPTDPSWDRWFEGPKHSQGCRCCIL